MLKFYKDISLAIDLINSLGQKPAKVSDLAPKLGTTHYNLQRIVRKLSGAGVIKTSRGKGGGLSQQPEHVTLRMVFSAFYEDPIESIKDSTKTSDRLNCLYLSFLSAVQIHEDGNALDQLKPLPIEQNLYDQLPPEDDEPEDFLEGIAKDLPGNADGDGYEVTEEDDDMDFSNGW